MSGIESMGLYRNVERIEADLAAAGIAADDALSVDDLTAFDQYHYEGTAAVDEAGAVIGAGPGQRILDVGSGLGGPARYLADRTGCSVTALELQRDMHDTARSLTRRCGLEDRVEHVCGDVLAGAAGVGRFAGLISMLCFLHIPDRTRLFEHCARALRPGGVIFIDDYFARGLLTADEQRTLAAKVSCPYVPDLDTYVGDLTGAGFVGVEVVDKTVDWSHFVGERYRRFQATRTDLADRYGKPTVAELDDFYGAVSELFAGGHLGGVRLVARLAPTFSDSRTEF